MDAPERITFETPAATKIVIKGIDKQAVGAIAADVRAMSQAGAVSRQGHSAMRTRSSAARKARPVRSKREGTANVYQA